MGSRPKPWRSIWTRTRRKDSMAMARSCCARGILLVSAVVPPWRRREKECEEEEEELHGRTCTENPIISNSISPQLANATPSEITETMKRILRLISLRPKEAETRRTETGVKACA
jgi:hypothetical protein